MVNILQSILGLGYSKNSVPPELTSVKTLNIFESRVRKNDVSSMIDDGCKSCSLCSS